MSSTSSPAAPAPWLHPSTWKRLALHSGSSSSEHNRHSQHSSTLILIPAIILVPLLIPPLIKGVINIVIEALNPSLLATSPPGDVLWHILDILHAIAPLPFDIVGNIFNLLRLAASPASDIAGCVFESLLNTVFVVVEALLHAVFVVVETFFVAVPVFLCEDVSMCRQQSDILDRMVLTDFFPLMHQQRPTSKSSHPRQCHITTGVIRLPLLFVGATSTSALPPSIRSAILLP
jgi:hypothetical protein